MQYDIEELLITGIMEDKAKIIVEGKDDILFYDRIAKMADKSVDIYAVENVNNGKEGCNAIVELVRNIQNKFQENTENEKYLLFIIDRDSRYYRNEIPSGLKGLFVLNKYSIENHFISDENINYLLKLVTSLTDDMITYDIIEKSKEYYLNELENFYLIGLEALKSACTNNYSGVVTYRCNGGYIYNNFNNLINRIIIKIDDLKDFENSLNLSILDVKNFVKGKWILHFFCANLINGFKNLSNHCKNNEIAKCQYCSTGKYDKCMYKFESRYSVGHLYDLIQKYICFNEVKYIIDKFNEMV